MFSLAKACLVNGAMFENSIHKFISHVTKNAGDVAFAKFQALMFSERLKEEEKARKKQEVKEQADIFMADPAPAIQELVDRAVDKKLAATNLLSGSPAPSPSPAPTAQSKNVQGDGAPKLKKTKNSRKNSKTKKQQITSEISTPSVSTPQAANLAPTPLFSPLIPPQIPPFPSRGLPSRDQASRGLPRRSPDFSNSGVHPSVPSSGKGSVDLETLSAALVQLGVPIGPNAHRRGPPFHSRVQRGGRGRRGRQ
jgi:hypothetical protein